MPSQGFCVFLPVAPKPARSYATSYGRPYDRDAKMKKDLGRLALSGLFHSHCQITEPFLFSKGTPLKIHLIFFHKKPKCRKTPGLLYKTTTPDVDNCSYLIVNALKSLIYFDDCQLSIIISEKYEHSNLEGILVKIDSLLQEEK